MNKPLSLGAMNLSQTADEEDPAESDVLAEQLFTPQVCIPAAAALTRCLINLLSVD